MKKPNKPSKITTMRETLALAKGERLVPQIGVNTDLAIDEQHIENCIKKGEVLAEDVGKTLAKIQAEKKYPERTFELYMKRRWGKSGRWGYLMIKGYENAKNFSQTSVDIKQLSSQSQVSELAKAAPEKQAEILDEVSKEGKVTAKKIAEKIKEKAAPVTADFRVIVRDANDEEVPEEIVKEFQRSRDEVKHVRSLLNEVRRWLEDEQPYKVELSQRSTIESLKDVLASVNVVAGAYICVKCKGKKCAVCHKRGFVSEAFYMMNYPKPKK
jgi:hypothetical protein